MQAPADTTPAQVLIRDMPSEERPRERLLRHGAEHLTNAELLAILLRTGTQGESVLALATRLLATFRGLRGIAAAGKAELSSVKGVSEAKYCELMAAMELGKRLAAVTAEDRPLITHPADVAKLLMPDMAGLQQEQMRVLLMNTRNEVVSVRTVYIGTVNTTSIRGAEVFKDAVREGLPGIILVHNHPSGDPTPSLMDREMTTQLRKAGRLLNVEVLDHIIIGRQGHYSLKETGWPLV